MLLHHLRFWGLILLPMQNGCATRVKSWGMKIHLLYSKGETNCCSCSPTVSSGFFIVIIARGFTQILCVCVVGWPGMGSNNGLLWELDCVWSGNFHYLPTSQNDFAIDRGFIKLAIPVFENTDKKERKSGGKKFHFFLNWVETSSGKLKKNPRGGEEQKK